MPPQARPTKVVGPGVRPTEREITVPGRAPPRPSTPAPGEVRTTRLLVVITAAAGLAFAVVAVVGFQLILYLARGPMQPTAPECVEGDPERDCEAGLFCQSGHCRPEVSESICEAGDACGRGECECVAPMSCQAGLCAAPADAQAPDVCDRPDIQRALAVLERDCKGDLGSCPPSDLKKFAMNYAGFDELMSAFPQTFTVHFPASLPPIDGGGDGSWPGAKTREYYVERLRPLASALRGARSIFIIARSSPHGNARRNEMYAQRRWLVTKELLFATLELTPGQHDDLSGKFREFILGPKRRLGRELFAQRYAHRFVTWDKDSRNQLLRLLKDESPGDEDADWLANTINQVVLVVPIPCELKPAAGD